MRRGEGFLNAPHCSVSAISCRTAGLSPPLACCASWGLLFTWSSLLGSLLSLGPARRRAPGSRELCPHLEKRTFPRNQKIARELPDLLAFITDSRRSPLLGCQVVRQGWPPLVTDRLQCQRAPLHSLRATWEGEVRDPVGSTGSVGGSRGNTVAAVHPCGECRSSDSTPDTGPGWGFRVALTSRRRHGPRVPATGTTPPVTRGRQGGASARRGSSGSTADPPGSLDASDQAEQEQSPVACVY